MRRRGRPKIADDVIIRKTVRLPEKLIAELEAEMKAAGCKTFSAYVRKLLEGE